MAARSCLPATTRALTCSSDDQRIRVVERRRFASRRVRHGLVHEPIPERPFQLVVADLGCLGVLNLVVREGGMVQRGHVELFLGGVVITIGMRRRGPKGKKGQSNGSVELGSLRRKVRSFPASPLGTAGKGRHTLTGSH